MAPEAPADSGDLGGDLRGQPPGAPPSPVQDLPAPYQDPFEALGQDIRAVVATLRLRVQELWRRNRQGDLSVPGFWPQDLAPLFWPMALALALACLIVLPVGLPRLLPEREPKPAEQAQKLLTTPLPEARPTAEPEALAAPELPAVPLPLATEPVALEPVPAPEPQPEPPALALDPLLELLSQQDPRHLIASARPQPASGVLELELTAGFAQLPVGERQAQAEGWLDCSRSMGYERLVLLDGSGIILGRQALVGSGMILLDVSAPS